MGGALLQVEDLQVAYELGRSIGERARRVPQRVARAVDGVSLAVDSGEFVALVGESGSGKTTAAHAMLGLVERNSGTVQLAGADPGRARGRHLRELRRRAQLIYQDPYESLNPRFRVSRTVAEPLEIHRVASADRPEQVRQVLERVGLAPAERFLERYPHELSGGQRQRVAIAAALILNPALLIADEPVSMLDVSVRAGVLTLLDELRRTEDLGILMITHDLSTASAVADRVAVMYRGRIVEQGPTAQVVEHPQHPYTKALLGAVPQADPELRRPPVPLLSADPSDPTAIPSGCRFRTRCPYAIDACAQVDPPLAATEDPDHLAACIRWRELAEPGRPVIRTRSQKEIS